MAEEPLAGDCQDQHTRHLCLEPVVEEDVIVPQYNTGEEAVVVWDSALVLSYFLLKHREKFIQGRKEQGVRTQTTPPKMLRFLREVGILCFGGSATSSFTGRVKLPVV